MDSPDQGVKGIPVDKISYINSILKLEIKSAMIEYSGVDLGDKILGTKRPQEPKQPYGYYEETFYCT